MHSTYPRAWYTTAGLMPCGTVTTYDTVSTAEPCVHTITFHHIQPARFHHSAINQKRVARTVSIRSLLAVPSDSPVSVTSDAVNAREPPLPSAFKCELTAVLRRSEAPLVTKLHRVTPDSRSSSCTWLDPPWANTYPFAARRHHRADEARAQNAQTPQK